MKKLHLKKILSIFGFLLFQFFNSASAVQFNSELKPLLSKMSKCKPIVIRNNCYDTVEEANGLRYLGEFLNGKKEGIGNQFQNSKLVFVGEFKNGKMHGQGKLHALNGINLEGEFIEGRLNGFGTSTYPDGTRYVGEYKNGKYHGFGTMKYPDGSTYVGENKYGQPNGRGVFTEPTGIKLIGDFSATGINGQGVLIKTDGTRIDVIFKDNQLQKITGRSDALGDGSENDLFCQRIGIKPGADDYDECRITIGVQKYIAMENEKQYQSLQLIYQKQLEAYHQERKTQQGLILLELAGKIVTSNRNDATFIAPTPPQPSFEQFNIYVRGRSPINCVSQSNFIDCR